MSGDRRRSRGALAWVLGAAGLLAVALLGGQSGDDEPFDPSSTGPAGTKGLVLLLEELGANVDVSSDLDAESTDLVVIARDGSSLDDQQLGMLDAFLEDGGTLVITDPFSPLTPEVAGPMAALGPFSTETSVEPDVCDVAPLADAGTIEVAGVLVYDTAGAEGSCYGDGEAAYVVEVADGGGRLVALAGTTPFTNEYLDQGDNAVLAANLMAPESDVSVTLLADALAEPTADSAFDLLDPGVGQAVVQLGIAFVIFAAWKARRLGRPLREPQPVDIAGSELVAAVGDLLQRTGQPARAAVLLREDLRLALCERLGLPVESAADVVATAVESRTGAPRARVEEVLVATRPTNDDELLALARQIESLRQEVLHGHPV
jgi:hypothetical protein